MNKTYVRAGLVTLFLCCLLQATAARADGRGECLSMRSRVLAGPVGYCVLLPPAYDADKTRRFPVLYYLHGLGDNEEMFLRSGGWSMIQDLWGRHDLGEFVIVTPAAGASFSSGVARSTVCYNPLQQSHAARRSDHLIVLFHPPGWTCCRRRPHRRRIDFNRQRPPPRVSVP